MLDWGAVSILINRQQLASSISSAAQVQSLKWYPGSHTLAASKRFKIFLSHNATSVNLTTIFQQNYGLCDWCFRARVWFKLSYYRAEKVKKLS